MIGTNARQTIPDLGVVEGLNSGTDASLAHLDRTLLCPAQ
jgi:hypothetical protein